MNTKDSNLSVMNLIYRVREILKNEGYSSANFTAQERDPYMANFSTLVFPVITVESDIQTYRPFELGSPNIKSPMFLIDIYAVNNHQRDDIADIICEDLDGNSIPLYDFNTGFPHAVGDYTGVSSIGSIVFQSPMQQNVEASPEEIGNIYKHHKLIMIRGDLIKT